MAKNEAELLSIYFIPLKGRERTSRTTYNLCKCITKQKINSNNYNRLLQSDWWIVTTSSNALQIMSSFHLNVVL